LILYPLYFLVLGNNENLKNSNLDDLSGEGFQNKCISFWVSRS